MALQITIVQAKGLPSADLNGFSDPYAEFIVNGVKHKTKTIKKTLNPYWGETFTFHSASFNPNTDSIRLDIYDWDRFSSNDLLTRNLLPISKYVAAGTVDEWVPLNSVKGGCRGSVQLKVIYGDGKPKVQPQQQQGGYSPRSAPPVPQHQQPYYGGGGAPSYPPPQHQPGYGQPPYGYAPPQQAYPSGGFPPQSGGYPPQQQQAYPSGGYPPQSGGYPPQQQHSYPSGGFPPQQQGLQAPQGGYPPQQQQGLQAPRWSGPSHGLPPHEIREAEEAFWRYDTDKSGTIDRNELKPLLRAIFGNRMSENLMDRYASAHFQSADTDRSGQIDFGEFLNLYSKLKPLANGRAV